MLVFRKSTLKIDTALRAVGAAIDGVVVGDSQKDHLGQIPSGEKRRQ